MEQLPAFLASHWLMTSALVVAIIVLIANEIYGLRYGTPRVTPSKLSYLINHEHGLVIDLRTVDEYRGGHITGAKNIPHSELSKKLALIADDKANPVILVCTNGHHSVVDSTILRKAGFQKVSYLGGGLNTWKNENMPLIQGKA